MKKFFRRALTAFLIVIFMLSSAIVGAKIQMYTATGEDYPSPVESQDISKKRALDKAIKKATKQAGEVLLTHSRSVNNELTDDEVTAITSNSWQLVGEPKYSREIINHSDDTQIIVWKVTVEVNVDDSEIQSWIKRDDKDKSTIISQTREAQKSSEENDRKIDDLREQYKHATSQAERDRIIKQMNDADRDFLANQKLEEGIKLFYQGKFGESIKFSSAAIEINPNYAKAYCFRAIAYGISGNIKQANLDFNKAIELEPNNAKIYAFRGQFYSANSLIKTLSGLSYDGQQAIKDFDKAISLDSKNADYYTYRGVVYKNLKQYERAIQDYDKAIQLNPNYAHAYNNRGEAYRLLKQYERSVQDFDKAIQLNPNDADSYYNRGDVYCELEQYERAIQDYTKAIKLNQFNPSAPIMYFGRSKAYALTGNFKQAIGDLNKAIELEPQINKVGVSLLGVLYKMRGACYQALGDNEKAQADFAKAKELGYNG